MTCRGRLGRSEAECEERCDKRRNEGAELKRSQEGLVQGEGEAGGKQRKECDTAVQKYKYSKSRQPLLRASPWGPSREAGGGAGCRGAWPCARHSLLTGPE